MRPEMPGPISDASVRQALTTEWWTKVDDGIWNLNRALELCQANGLASIAYPAISTGVYGFPANRAAKIAVSTVADTLAEAPAVTRVIFCCFSDVSGRLHEAALASFGSPCA